MKASSSPLTSPNKASYGDRFIPTRGGARWHINFDSPNLEAETATRAAATQTRKAKEVSSTDGESVTIYSIHCCV